ncbi:hypothetical protein K0504_06345 [Neiella marina]|uniref:Uncharacterized protein n=1 Tax=Neiella holothuriorum TaxID=2870530 RepID=A0ABS7EE87_9GAMM|nr:hypothetical protein [Neiella holothuriorum]MBW8190653.1 hypothetical protein [Neiella holothuriorum]
MTKELTKMQSLLVEAVITGDTNRASSLLPYMRRREVYLTPRAYAEHCSHDLEPEALLQHIEALDGFIRTVL